MYPESKNLSSLSLSVHLKTAFLQKLASTVATDNGQ